MTDFFITLPPQPKQPSITYNTKVLLLGSCFAENIGHQLLHHKFQTQVNPFGIIFNPAAIANLVERVILQKQFVESDLFFHNEQWHCFEVHSQLSNSNKKELLQTLNTLLNSTYNHLKTSTHIILTYGTSWVYEHIESTQIVANCHKIPQKKFKKTLLSSKQIEKYTFQIFKFLKKINPALNIITTVSPVRHIKDGIIQNNRSKAKLLSALHNTIENTKHTYYYPAYELVIDCLRDYRFYKPDLIHPNQTAINYIWSHFKSTWIHDSNTQNTIKQISEIQKALQHKPLNPNSEAHKKFATKLQLKINELQAKLPFIKF